MIVPDASVLLEYLLQTPAGRGLGDRLFAPGETLHAPELIDLEVTQVARRYLIAGEISARRATRLVEDLSDLPLTRYPHTWMLPRHPGAALKVQQILARTSDTRQDRVPRSPTDAH